METKVFLIDEHKDTIFDSDKNQEWLNLVKELGLTCQESLMEKGKSPIPFPLMTEAESKIYGKVLDTHVSYKQFTGEAIPLPCLSAIALSEKEGYFQKIEIWYSRENPDPMVVGRQYVSESDRQNNYEWMMGCYKVAQWGAQLKPVSELLPLWDKAERDNIESTHEYSIRQHEDLMRKFTFQINAYQ